MKSFLTIALVFLLVIPQSLLSDPKTSSPKDFNNSFRVAMEILKEYGTVDDPEIQKRINEIGYRVAQRASSDMTYFSFYVVKMDEPNAFALPGGFIFITTGMLELDLTDDELAALLGHEIIHVRNEHSRKLSKRQTIMNLLYQALIMGIAFGLKDDGSSYDPVTGTYRESQKSEILQGTSAFGLVFQELLLRGFSREMELESDYEGMVAASRAGFSPKGTSSLFEKMRQRIYEAPGYGYWRTHPYLEDRMEIARSLSVSFTPAKNPADSTEFREETQETFLTLSEKEKEEQPKKDLRLMALNAYPKGATAGKLRLEIIEEKEAVETKKDPFFRDYGKLKTLYERNIDALKDDDIHQSASGVTFDISHPSSELLVKLEKKLADLNVETEKIKPEYEKVLQKETYDTETLRRFLSNFPDSSQVPEVQFQLAEAYRILNKKAEAVDLYLSVMNGTQDSIWKEKSKLSLLETLPRLDDLSSCYKVSRQSRDPQLVTASEERMKSLVGNFSSLQVGYEFRRSYHTSEFEKPVREHMNRLASETLNKAKLYQAVGEYQKALDHYNEILRYCSDLPIADQVKDSIIDFQELPSVKGKTG